MPTLWNVKDTNRFLERSPCETPIHDRSGISCFSKRGGVPLPLSMGVLGTCDFRRYTKAETLAKIDPKCRRVLNQKRWFEWAAIIFFQECVTWRSTSNLNCIKKAGQPIFGLIKNSKITDIHRKSFRFKIDCGSTNESKLYDNSINNCVTYVLDCFKIVWHRLHSCHTILKQTRLHFGPFLATVLGFKYRSNSGVFKTPMLTDRGDPLFFKNTKSHF